MESFAIFGLLVAHEVQERHVGLASQLVDELALPEEHDVSLRLDRFFLKSTVTQARLTSSSLTHFPSIGAKVERNLTFAEVMMRLNQHGFLFYCESEIP